jgi:hypothetical protein
MIAASDSAGKAPARGAARASDKDADNSPFAILLAETAQQPAQKQSPAPADKDDAAKPPVEAADTQNDADQTDTAPAAQTASVPRDGKRDAKSDNDNNDQTGDAAAAQVQVQVPAPVTPLLVAVIQANPQAGTIQAPPDQDPGQAVPADSGESKTDPAVPRAAAQPVNDNPSAVSTPPAVQAASDDSDATDTLPPLVITAANPSTPDLADDDKPVTGKTAKPASDQPQPAEAPTPTPATDASAILQAAMTTPAPANTSPAANDADDDAAVTTQIAAAAPAKSKNDGTKPAGKAEPADPTGKPATVPGPASLPPTASPVAVARTELAKDNGPAKSNDDTKPTHVADAQPEVPASPPPAMPAPSLPHLAANGFGIVPPPAAANNAAVTSAVQIKLANAEPAPDLDALAVSVAARAMSGAKQFEIRLDPPELGRVDVRLSIDASGKTQAHMTADQPQTLDLLQKDATNLTQALRDAGLDVSQGGLNFSLRGQDRQADSGNNGGPQGRRTNLIATRALQAVQSPGAISFNGAAKNARVDIHV